MALCVLISLTTWNCWNTKHYTNHAKLLSMYVAFVCVRTCTCFIGHGCRKGEGSRGVVAPLVLCISCLLCTPMQSMWHLSSVQHSLIGKIILLLPCRDLCIIPYFAVLYCVLDTCIILLFIVHNNNLSIPSCTPVRIAKASVQSHRPGPVNIFHTATITEAFLAWRALSLSS